MVVYGANNRRGVFFALKDCPSFSSNTCQGSEAMALDRITTERQKAESPMTFDRLTLIPEAVIPPRNH